MDSLKNNGTDYLQSVDINDPGLAANHNPVEAGIVRAVSDYLYSSVVDYEGGRLDRNRGIAISPKAQVGLWLHPGTLRLALAGNLGQLF